MQHTIEEWLARQLKITDNLDDGDLAETIEITCRSIRACTLLRTHLRELFHVTSVYELNKSQMRELFRHVQAWAILQTNYIETVDNPPSTTKETLNSVKTLVQGEGDKIIAFTRK